MHHQCAKVADTPQISAKNEYASLPHFFVCMRMHVSVLEPEEAKANPTIRHAIILEAGVVAKELACKRMFVQKETLPDGAQALTFDPRFLVAEFTYNLMLRGSQVLFEFFCFDFGDCFVGGR